MELQQAFGAVLMAAHQYQINEEIDEELDLTFEVCSKLNRVYFIWNNRKEEGRDGYLTPQDSPNYFTTKDYIKVDENTTLDDLLKESDRIMYNVQNTEIETI